MLLIEVSECQGTKMSNEFAIDEYSVGLAVLAESLGVRCDFTGDGVMLYVVNHGLGAGDCDDVWKSLELRVVTHGGDWTMTSRYRWMRPDSIISESTTPM